MRLIIIILQYLHVAVKITPLWLLAADMKMDVDTFFFLRTFSEMCTVIPGFILAHAPTHYSRFHTGPSSENNFYCSVGSWGSA